MLRFTLTKYPHKILKLSLQCTITLQGNAVQFINYREVCYRLVDSPLCADSVLGCHGRIRWTDDSEVVSAEWAAPLVNQRGEEAIQADRQPLIVLV